MAAITAVQVLVSPLLGVVFKNLDSLIQKEIGLVLGVNKELEKLSNTLATIRDVLEDAEVKQIDDKPINNWLRKLKDLAYEADDIVDECATELLIPESDVVRNNSWNIQVTSPSDSSCFDFKRIMFRRSIGKRIKNLIQNFDEMAELRSKFHLTLITKHVESGRNEHRETSSTLTEPQVYGREEEKQHIANLLLEGGDEVSVCCIVGMGGLGKTTLAQLVYNDENITNHFQLKCWVCVSDDFVLRKLLKSIIESTGGNARDLEDLDPLESRVKGILRGKKFLLVLDDVWNENQTKWNKLKSSLICGGKGSSIIVTTRLESVASLTSSMLPIRRLEILSAENCWSLFKDNAFDVENNEYHQKFEEIGKEIVNRCGGVPLAVKALGGLLRFKKTENEWLFVRDSALWDLPQDKESDILPALRLSYNHLPSHSKQCFSFCSIFTKDCIMEKEELINLWMANGFVQPKGSMGLEDIGNEIFNELLLRSFFQDAGQRNTDGEIMYCKMHDLMHDLACSIMVNECMTVEVDKYNNVFKPPTRHMLLQFGSSFLSSDVVNIWLSKSQPLLRTFFQTNVLRWYEHVIQGLTFTNLKCLRVLDLSHTDINTLHISISNLKHLRYLDLSFCQQLRSLPDESICNLRNLLVLKLNYCRKLQALPKSISKITNLRHLGIKGCDELRRMPVEMGNLSCLRTLSMFIVVPKSGCGISELGGLDHLRGKLEIKGLQHVKNLKDARNANLIRKKNLRVLKLFWSEENNCDIEVGEGLQPHPNIKKLYLQCYNGLNFPIWISHSCLPNLIKVSLVGCRRCEHLPPLGLLPLLEILEISGMDSVKCIGDEFYGDHQPEGSFFPRVKQFEIREMPNLEEWYAPSSKEEEEENIRVFSSLKCLTLEGCPKLRTMPTTMLSAVTELILGAECSEMVLESSLVEVIGCLQRLEIRSYTKIETLPKVLLENIPSTLTHLCIYHGKELVCLPGEMQNLSSLESLDIIDCPSLKYLPELGSKNTAMTRLEIEQCSVLTHLSEGLRHLTSLEYLSIKRCPMLEFFPDDFQDLTSLRELAISTLPLMTCLPEGLQQVAGTLECLDIFSCLLTSLPEWMYKLTSFRKLCMGDCRNLKVLPDEVLRLATLETVIVRDCHPDLHRRYARGTGEDWHKIAHIPDLRIIETTWKSMMPQNIGGGERSMKCNIIPCFSSSSSGTN